MRYGALVLALFLVACAGQEDAGQPGAPFLGGQTGIDMSFLEDSPPDVVFDSGQMSFDVVVKLENKGEWDVPRDRIFVDLIGFEPALFGKSAAALTKSPDDDLPGRGLEEFRQQVTSAFVEFRDLRYQKEIQGAQLQFPFRAEACYLYGTFATTKLCSRNNLVAPAPDGLCDVTGDKEIFNSGAPVQVTSLVQSVRSEDRIGFTFKVSHVGKGRIFERGNLCDDSVRHLRNRVFVEVTGVDARCSGLEGEGGSGFATLHGGSKTVTCTYQVAQPRDEEIPLTIVLTYDYQQRMDTQVTVKHSIN